MCDFTFLGVCFTRPPVDVGSPIFGFAEFLTALALLVLVYSFSDPRYKFRIAIAPLPLEWITFGATLFIGFGSLLTELWFAQRLPSPAWGLDRAVIQAFLGFLFLAVVLSWVWYAFLVPATFGRFNSRSYFTAVYSRIVQGSEPELAMLANEIGRSSASLIKLAAVPLARADAEEREDDDRPKTRAEDYAYETLSLLASPNLCRHFVESPTTAMLLMREASQQEKRDVPLGPLVSNITAESILDKDSNLYHEGNYRAGFVSLAQPFSKEMYGDYLLIESLSQQFPGPFDVDSDITKDFSSRQLEAFCRIVLVTYNNYVEIDWYCQRSYALNRAFDTIQKSASWGMYELDGVEEHYPNDKTDRLRVAVRFVQSALEILSAKSDLRLGTLRARSDVGRHSSVVDPIAKLMLELLHAAALVRRPWGTAWTVQHNTAWSEVFYG